MTFSDIQFPTDISYGATGGPEYSTDVVTTGSGYEQRNINWSEARGTWNVAHGVKNPTQMANLLAFFRIAMGRANTFRFKDWTDFKVTKQWIATGDGALKTFQLRRVYFYGEYYHIRDVKKPVFGTLRIYFGKDSPVEQTTGWTCDYDTGIVTFDVAPLANTWITASFEFDCACRFNIDKMDINYKDFNALEWATIEVIEVRT